MKKKKTTSKTTKSRTRAKSRTTKTKKRATRKRTTTRAKGRPKKAKRYVKTINVRFTKEQWSEIITWSEKSHLEPSVYLRKIILDFLNIKADKR